MRDENQTELVKSTLTLRFCEHSSCYNMESCNQIRIDVCRKDFSRGVE